MQSSSLFSNSKSWVVPKRNSITGNIARVKSPQSSYSSSLSSSLACLSSHRLILTSQFQYQTPSNDPTSSLPTNFIRVRRPAKTRTLSPLFCSISSNTLNIDGNRSFWGWVEVIGEAVSTAFPVWVALGCLLGLIKPSSFSWVQPRWTILGITFTMLGMGMTLTLDDLCGALAMPKELLAGFILQYSFVLMMVVAGYAVIRICGEQAFKVAILLCTWFNIGCLLPHFTSFSLIGAGTASNIVTYIARGNVALSVLMTAASTLSAVVMTPFLAAKLAGQFVAVDATGLFISTLQVVLLPVLAGTFLNQYFQSLVKFVAPVMPPIAVATVAVLCGHAIAQNASAILMSGSQVILVVFLLHASGFFFGYLLSRILEIDVSSSRTISIEVGMQNSVLGVVLAGQHFGNPLTAVPCAVSSVCHSIFGSLLAVLWRRTKPTQMQ